MWMPQRRRRCKLFAVSVRLLSIAAFLCLFQTAHAEEITPWNFLGGLPQKAQTIQRSDNSVELQTTKGGLYIATPQDGYIIWTGHPLEGPAEVITIRIQASRPAKAALLWEAPNGPENQLVQLAFDVPPSTQMQDIDIVVAGYPQWDWHTDKFGIAFPAGSEATVEEIRFRHWPFYERVIERWKSFWTFDEFRPYSINFLWGPLLAGNGPQREALFKTLPPSAPSVTRGIYGLFIVAGIAAYLIGRTQWRRAKTIGWMTLLFAVVWLAFAFRMDAEILSYAVHDLKTWTFTEPLSAKRMRNYEDVHATVFAMAPELQQHDSFAMLVPYREVYFQMLRYYAYPSVILPEPATWSGATAWAVLDRDDVWVDDQNRLRLGKDPATAQILTPPGHVAVPFKKSSFLFTVP
jgi:hypothetical protein